jgi:hypothetical protein
MADKRSLEEKVDGLVEDVAAVKTALAGYNGQPGLCKDHEELKSNFFKFRNTVITVAAFLLGSGLLGTGIWKLIEIARA